MTLPAMPPPLKACAQCSLLLPDDELIQISGKWICAGCKPRVLQMLREGVTDTAAPNVTRFGKNAILANDSPLPDRCFKCNEPAPGPHKKTTLYWHPPAYYFLILFPGILIYAIVAMIIRKRAVVEVPLCETHRRKRRNAIFITCGLILLLFPAWLVAAGATEDGLFVVLAILSLLGGIIYGCIAIPLAHCQRIEDQPRQVWLRGAGRKFLESLDETVAP